MPRWELQATGDGLWITFPFSAAYQASDITSGSSADKKTTQETTQETTRETTRERILALLKAEPELTRRILAERVGLTPNGVKYHLTRLREAGVIRHVGPTKAGRWEALK